MLPDDRPDKLAKFKPTLDESAQRRVVLRDLLAHGVPREQIDAEMAARFQMSSEAVRRLAAELDVDDEREFAEDAKNSKRRQLHRLKQHLAKAAASKQFTAVSNLEKTIAEIEGNLAPIEHRTSSTEAVLAGALAEICARMSQEKAARLLERHARRRALATGGSISTPLLPGKVQDAEFEPAA